MAAAPELAPFAARVVLRQLIWPFTALTAYMFGWGLLNALDAFSRACFGTAAGAVGWIPYAGRILSTGLHGVEHKISSILGRWISYFEVQAGIRWHGLGQVVSQLAADVEAAALMDWTIVKRLSHFLTQAQVHLLLKGLHAVGKVLVQRTTIVEQKVIRVEKVATHTVTTHVLPRVGAIEGEIGHVIEWDIPRLRAREKGLSDSLGRLWHRIRSEPRALVGAALAAAVALALGRLGAGWVRCRNWNRIGKQVCNTPLGDIEALLGLLATGAVIADFRELVKLGQTVEHGVASALQDVAKL